MKTTTNAALLIKIMLVLEELEAPVLGKNKQLLELDERLIAFAKNSIVDYNDLAKQLLQSKNDQIAILRESNELMMELKLANDYMDTLGIGVDSTDHKGEKVPIIERIQWLQDVRKQQAYELARFRTGEENMEIRELNETSNPVVANIAPFNSYFESRNILGQDSHNPAGGDLFEEDFEVD